MVIEKEGVVSRRGMKAKLLFYRLLLNIASLELFQKEKNEKKSCVFE